jgi:hypothetical protein
MKADIFWDTAPYNPLKVNPIQNHENASMSNIGQGEAKLRGLNVAAVKRTTVQVTKLPL